MKCPHCQHAIHIDFQVTKILQFRGDYWKSHTGTCPSCSGAIIFLGHYKDAPAPFMAYPKSTGRPGVPASVDSHIAKDYTEACLVFSDSPKASAALSRRCLQAVLREKAGIKPGDLANEIQQVLDSKSLPSYLAENIDAIRHIGNFAAHPIKSKHSGEIVEVELHEAEWQLDVLEQLFDFYYVGPAEAKKRRDALNTKLAEIQKPPMKG